MIVSISGMENAGKTTQCKTLKEQYPDVFQEIIHINNSCFFNHERFNESWWFDPGNEEFFVKSIYLCLLERISMAKKINGIVLFDKGMDFYDTKVISVLMIKGLSYEEAVIMQNQIKARYILNDNEIIKLFLESGTYKRRPLDLSNPNDIRYSRYLDLNKKLLDENMSPFVVIPTSSMEIVTQNIIEKIIECSGGEECLKNKLLIK